MDDPANCTAPENANSTYCKSLDQRNADIAFATSLALNAGLFLLFGVLFLIFYHVRMSAAERGCHD